MKYPAIDLSYVHWGNSVNVPIYFDPIVYFIGFTSFERSYKNHLFCDAVGDLYLVVDMIPPKALWRRIFKFIPWVYKVELVFEKQDEPMSVEELRKHMLGCLYAAGNLKAQDYMIDRLENARTHRALLGENR